MAEYIEREAFKQKYLCCGYLPEMSEKEFDEFPAADVAEVVRCKDCDAWKRNVGIVDSPNGHCFEHDIDTNGQDFCSYGEYQINTGGNGNVSD